MSVRVRVLGGFEVAVGGHSVDAALWSRRHVAALVKLLALADGHRLHREQVMETLWPSLLSDAAAPRLHKAAHYARRALGEHGVVLRNDLVALFPGEEVTVDAEVFLRAGREAIAQRSPAAAGDALAAYRGQVLPDDLYESWTEPRRAEVQVVHLDLLRLARRWADVLAVEPADEQAHLALAQGHADAGDRRAALRQLERLEQALQRELGTTPGPAVLELRARLRGRGDLDREALARPSVRAVVPSPRRRTRLVGRGELGRALQDRVDLAASGRGGALVLSGPAGVGKSALVDLAVAHAATRGVRTGRGTAAVVEGPWPYAPVLEALGDLCRRHPALLDGLDDTYREEIDRALTGRPEPWTGESAHQRLFVAAAELLRLAAAGHGLLLVVDDLHDADEASVRLLHYLARCAASEPVLVLLAGRPLAAGPVRDVVDSLVARAPGSRLDVLPLSPSATSRLLAEAAPELPAAQREELVALSAGIPFTALELARQVGTGRSGDVLPPLPAPVLETFGYVALLGSTFTTDELLAVADVDEDEAYRQLETAQSALLVEDAGAGHRFRHALLREALLDRLPPSARAAARRHVAERLTDLGAPPARVAHQLIAAGLPSRAVPAVLEAVEAAGALGAYRDALDLVDAVRHHARGEQLARLLARRGDLLMAMGDPTAVTAYREALAGTSGTEHRLVRARLARAATFAGDLDTARAALAGLELEGDRADGPLLMARGNLSYFSGDVDTAWQVAGQAREMLDVTGDSWHVLDLVSLQGLLAHQRGEWFDRFRLEMRRTAGKERLATAVFDAHLCVAEYVLYGPVPYTDVIAQAEDLRRRAEHAGALRGVAFATALIGEASLLMGDLGRAEAELQDSVALHRDIDASAGEAHGLQRLAEVRLAQGDRGEAERLLRRALPLARWSMVSMHLLQRIYGTMIAAAPDPVAARVVVDEAEASLGETDHCPFCDVMLAVPAAIACADVGDVAQAQHHLVCAEASAARWAGTAWPAAVEEARAHLAGAEGRGEDVAPGFRRAAELFDAAGQHQDAERCRAAAERGVPAAAL